MHNLTWYLGCGPPPRMPVTTRIITFSSRGSLLILIYHCLREGGHAQYQADSPTSPKPFPVQPTQVAIVCSTLQCRGAFGGRLANGRKVLTVLCQQLLQDVLRWISPVKGRHPDWRKVYEPLACRAMEMLLDHFRNPKKKACCYLLPHLLRAVPGERERERKKKCQPQCGHICHVLGKSLLLSPPITSQILGTASYMNM